MDAVKWEPSSMMGVPDDLGVSDNLLELVKGDDLNDDIIPQGEFFFLISGVTFVPSDRMEFIGFFIFKFQIFSMK